MKLRKMMTIMTVWIDIERIHSTRMIQILRKTNHFVLAFSLNTSVSQPSRDGSSNSVQSAVTLFGSVASSAESAGEVDKREYAFSPLGVSGRVK